jgi:hypothetical protein
MEEKLSKLYILWKSFVFLCALCFARFVPQKILKKKEGIGKIVLAMRIKDAVNYISTTQATG